MIAVVDGHLLIKMRRSNQLLAVRSLAGYGGIMNESSLRIKNILIVGLIVLITMFHYNSIQGTLGIHLFHRELYYGYS